MRCVVVERVGLREETVGVEIRMQGWNNSHAFVRRRGDGLEEFLEALLVDDRVDERIFVDLESLQVRGKEPLGGQIRDGLVTGHRVVGLQQLPLLVHLRVDRVDV